MPQESPKPKPVVRFFLAIVVALVAWFLPGFGHLLLRRWGRGVVFFVVVSALALSGLLLRGHVFSLEVKDAFEVLGVLSNLGAGAYYFLSRYLETAGPDVSRAAGDFGTRFFATAGVLNFLCVIDAHSIAMGRKS